MRSVTDPLITFSDDVVVNCVFFHSFFFMIFVCHSTTESHHVQPRLCARECYCATAFFYMTIFSLHIVIAVTQFSDIILCRCVHACVRMCKNKQIHVKTDVRVLTEITFCLVRWSSVFFIFYFFFVKSIHCYCFCGSACGQRVKVVHAARIVYGDQRLIDLVCLKLSWIYGI